MEARKISGTAAWIAAMRGPATRWSDHIDRFASASVGVDHAPKFRIQKDDKFFCIGSCFARNIEEHLMYRGVDVRSRGIISPKDEWSGRVNGFVNKFTTHSMRNEIDWVADPPLVDASMFEEQAEGWIDHQLCPGVRPASLNRAIERRTYLTSRYFSKLAECSIVVLTLGLNEVWFDHATKRHLNAPPTYYATKREPTRYELHVTNVDQNLTELNHIRNLILASNKEAKIIVTVSPVPMSETFSGQDVFVANMYSKSTLRAAAETFAHSHDNVDYFPSYDIISMSPRATAYGLDCLHVSDLLVGQMMQLFLRLYLGVEPEAVSFNDVAYLEANPDVEAAVRRGEYTSGFDHWQWHGRTEGRNLYPTGGPTPLMITVGAV